MAALRFDRVTFRYGGHTVLEDVSFEIAETETLVLLGPSGSGKSTALRLAAGLERPAAGRIFLKGDVASEIEPSRRRTSLVFQDLGLWPHMTAEEHIAFAGPNLAAEDRRALLASVNLEPLSERLPSHMSGGERQRLALARALASQPRLLLLDEPFANLDPSLRAELRDLLLDLHEKRSVSLLYVTHDLEDAFRLGERIGVLNAGKLEQVGLPEDLYKRPRTTFVAGFVGKGALVPGRAQGAYLETPFGTLPNPRPELPLRKEITVLFRPEDVEISSDGVSARVESVTFGAGAYLVQMKVEGSLLWAHSSRRISPGETVQVRPRNGWPIVAG